MVTQCPICKEYLVGYNWTKTQSNKNWIKHKDKGWHNCPKKSFKKKTAGKSQKLTSFNATQFGPLVEVPNGFRRRDLEPNDHDAHTLYYSPSKGDWYSPYLDDQGKEIRYKKEELEQARKDGYTDINALYKQ
jgi:hypothetical protein